MVVVTMGLTLISGVLFARLFGRGDLYGALAGGATAVCGASAALATASVLPDYKGREADTAFVAITVNLLATAAMLAYPADLRRPGVRRPNDRHISWSDDPRRRPGRRRGLRCVGYGRECGNRRQALSRLDAAAGRHGGGLVVCRQRRRFS